MSHQDEDRVIPLSVVRSVLVHEIIGEIVHTALRKWCAGGMEAHDAIARMPAGEWPRAMECVAEVLIEYIERELPPLAAEDATCSACDAECSGRH